jgi:hypothetical protein
VWGVSVRRRRRRTGRSRRRKQSTNGGPAVLQGMEGGREGGRGGRDKVVGRAGGWVSEAVGLEERGREGGREGGREVEMGGVD